MKDSHVITRDLGELASHFEVISPSTDVHDHGDQNIPVCAGKLLQQLLGEVWKCTRNMWIFSLRNSKRQIA
jgi:hypothetical protein